MGDRDRDHIAHGETRSLDDTLIGSWITLFATACIYTPIVFYCAITLWNHRNLEIMKKRRSALIFVCLVSTFLFVITSFVSMDVICTFPFCYELSDTTKFALMHIGYITDTVALMARCWFLFFDFRFGEAVLSMQWWKYIDISHRNWFILHRKSWGSFRKSIHYWIVFDILIIVLLTLAHHFAGPMIAWTASTLALIAFLSCTTMLYCLLKKSNCDGFYIIDELKIILLVYILGFGVNVGGFASGWAIHSIIGGQMVYWFLFVRSLVLISMMTLYPLRRRKREIGGNRSRPHLRSNGTGTVSTTKSSSDALNCLAWSEYVSKSHIHFDQFMQFLIRDIATENLCFILEAMQYKANLVNMMQKMVHLTGMTALTLSPPASSNTLPSTMSSERSSAESQTPSQTPLHAPTAGATASATARTTAANTDDKSERGSDREHGDNEIGDEIESEMRRIVGLSNLKNKARKLSANANANATMAAEVIRMTAMANKHSPDTDTDSERDRNANAATVTIITLTTSDTRESALTTPSRLPSSPSAMLGAMKNDRCFIRLPAALPSSKILEVAQNPYQQIVLLYRKYLSAGTALQLNVSFDCQQTMLRVWQSSEVNANRNQQLESVDDMTELSELFFIFDEVICEICLLLDSSYHRFRAEMLGIR